MQFPDVEGENLVGQPLAFPRDFTKRTVVIVAFDLNQRTDIESWVPFVDRFARDGTAPGFVFALVARAMRMMKGMIVTTMRKASPSPEALAATVPLFVDIDAFCAQLAIHDRSTIHIFVVESDGSIFEHQTGSYTERAAAAIEAVVQVST